MNDAYAKAYGVIFPAWQRVVNGRTIAGYLTELERTQWSAPEQIAQAQAASLRAILTRAKRTKYYREVFATIGFDPRDLTSRDHLAQLPLLTREIIHERYDDLTDPGRGATIRKGTSGTTGRPLQFEYSNDSEAWRQALRLRGYSWAGYRQGLPAVHFWARPAIAPRGVTAAKIRLDRALRREFYVDAAQQDEASLRQAAAIVRQVSPRAIIGYAKATALFARFVNDHGLRSWGSDIPVLCGAEALLPADRAAIERAFGPAFETYGSRETMLVGAECEAHAGLHLSEENLVVEIVRNGTSVRPVPHGETGEVVITDLHNDAMPFIRYLNGDQASMAPGPCTCGRGLRRLARIDGRTCDTLRDPNGAPIPGVLFAALFARGDDLVRQYQVVQRQSGDVLLRIVPGHDWNEGTFAQLEQRFREQLRGLPLEIERRETIAVTAGGKLRPIVVE